MTMKVYVVYEDSVLMDCQGSLWSIHQFETVLPTRELADEFVKTHPAYDGEWVVQELVLNYPGDIEDLL